MLNHSFYQFSFGEKRPLNETKRICRQDVRFIQSVVDFVMSNKHIHFRLHTIFTYEHKSLVSFRPFLSSHSASHFIELICSKIHWSWHSIWFEWCHWRQFSFSLHFLLHIVFQWTNETKIVQENVKRNEKSNSIR